MNTNLISLFFCYSILLNSQNDILIINVNNQNCIQLLIEKQQPMSTSDNNFNKDQSPDTMPKQGYNTKNRLKKKAKKDNGMQKNKQQRITNYFNANYFSSSNQAAPDPEEVKINELKQQMNLKDKQIDKLREQKQFIQNKMSLLYMQTKTYKNKTKEVLIKTLTQNAQIKRQIRRRVDMKLGYFTNDMRDFVFGEEFAGIQLVIKQKNTELDMLTSQLRKCKSDEQKDRLKFAMNFVKKQIAAKEQQFKNKQKTLAAYKAKLKLGVQELKCYYAQEKWPIVKDSLGYERYVTLELVGKGGFGEVYKCYDLQKNQYVAIKINLYQNKKQDQTILKHVKRQVETQKSLKHPNIVQIKQILQVSESRIIFVLQFCEGPQLSLYIRQRKCIQQRDAKNIIHQVFCALNYLNQLDKKVIHYDLKPSNIIFHHGKIKILDFGLCKLMDSKDDWMQLTSQGLGTYYYLPPQTFERQKTATISDNVDVWSAGVIFYEMLYGKKPFGQGVSQKVILKKDLILNSAKKLQFPIQNPNKYKISSEAKNFIQQCLCYEPQKRLSISEAYNHSYFKL